ncbi:hypothetical protein LSTR_LSTR005136 [Laodelphax striatellus]|uniref:C2H2-type domain-containing protein n=1 Tax=Laodelphax striatellus TaxID=195883 RepID=A0A482WQ57_LAOST|nr:hypothetical protein LSTR_LSTR005136 [Laodelphax striatellus]
MLRGTDAPRCFPLAPVSHAPFHPPIGIRRGCHATLVALADHVFECSAQLYLGLRSDLVFEVEMGEELKINRKFGKEMTMDIHQREREREFLAGGGSPSSHSPTPLVTPTMVAPKASKRSFDVAFLMAPDDLSKKRQQQLRLVTTASLMQRYSPPVVGSVQIRQEPTPPQLSTSPYGLLIPGSRDYTLKDTPKSPSPTFTKSAFTKVTADTSRLELVTHMPPRPASPSSVSSGGGVSPDVSYQESLSPPAISDRSSPYGKSVPPFFAASGKPAAYIYQNSVMRGGDKSEERRSSPVENNHQSGSYLGYVSKSPPLNLIEKVPKVRQGLIYPEGFPPSPYGGLTVATYPFQTNFSPPVPPHPLLTAAANVTAAALLPPSLAALTLPAQNVCAKCNISFRMTSDLVYHMRSHHKGESNTSDAARRRREQEKLKCPVCNESFRERHHLTRHMTAHQDKEGDVDDDSVSETPSRSRVASK